MKIYTRGGDKGKTALLNNSRVSKTDERIELVGTIDELNSHLGLAKVQGDEEMKEEISQIQRTLMKIMTAVVASAPGPYKLKDDEITALEKRIDYIEAAYPRTGEFVLYGGSELSARLDVARAVARRAERQFYRVEKYHAVDEQALKYMNRLSDYLYMLARYVDCDMKSDDSEKLCAAAIREVLKALSRKK